MADEPDSVRDAQRANGGEERHTPRWVKVTAVVAAAIAVVFVGAMLLGGGHGPGRHVPSGDDEGGPATTAVPGVHRRPAGEH